MNELDQINKKLSELKKAKSEILKKQKTKMLFVIEVDKHAKLNELSNKLGRSSASLIREGIDLIINKY